jgi:hypothetical protein
MEEPGGASRDVSLVSRARRLLQTLGVPEAPAIAEVMALYRDHPRWAVWLPRPGGQWSAARPATSHPPGPGMATIWVDASTAAELSERMRQADAALPTG